MAIDCYNLFKCGKHDSAEATVAFLTKKYPDVSHYFGRIHLEIMKYYSIQGSWDKTREVGDRIISLHKKNNEILIEAKNWMAKTSLGRVEKQKATDILNQCASAIDELASKWEAWMIIAEIYEYNNKYSDALAIYKKIYTDCPKNLPIPWKARIRMGELSTLQRQPQEKPASIFKSVSGKHQMFMEPWLVAQLYTGSIGNKTFKRRWQLLHPGDPYYLYHLSFKSVIQNDYKLAIGYLQKLRRSISQYTWRHARIKSTIEYYKIRKRNR
jgi:tetratricopeptide (TPR) repeat protein